MIDLATILKYYKRRDVQEAIVEHAQDREVASRYNDSFGTRPNVLNYPQDVFEEAKKGASSFHASEERWTNPLKLSPTLSRKELDEIRKGFDLVIDIDCKVLQYSQIAAQLILQEFYSHGIESVSVKFSGNKGFHLGVPYEAFPEKVHGKDTKLLFPDVPKRVAFYLRQRIKKRLADAIMEEEKDIQKVIEKTHKGFKEIVKDGKLDVESFLEIDTVLISSRHLYRMPYSFNEKSGLVSIPLDPKKIMEFKREDAQADKVVVNEFSFLKRETAKKEEAKFLFTEAFDKTFDEEQKREEYMPRQEKQFEIPKTAVPEIFFPPCIKKLLEGIDDGRKRGLFILINFLFSVGWSYEQIEARLKEWNQKNREPLREVYLVGQLRYRKQQAKKVLPPNCANKNYYEDLRIKCPPEICNRYKNPVNYARRKGASAAVEDAKAKKPKAAKQKL